MGRLPKIRTSYQNDAGHLSRLSLAVEMDPKAMPKWKVEVLALLNTLTRLMMEESARRM